MRAVIAVVGCDGAGKSRLTSDLVTALAGERPVEFVYLGQSSGNLLTAIRGIPLMGEAVGRFLKRRSTRAHADEGRAAAPDLATALVVHLLSHWRLYKFRRVRALDRGGTVVVTDRFPQAEVSGFYFDGPGLDPAGLRGVVRWIARREQRLYRRMATHLPALIVRLNVDAETARRRKPDHKASMLEDKVRVIPGLTFGGARIIDLDGRAPYPHVLEAASRAAREALEMPASRLPSIADIAKGAFPAATRPARIDASALRHRAANDLVSSLETGA